METEMTTAQQIFESHERFEKVKALAERGATPGERAAAQAAIERAFPEIARIDALSDDELLAELCG